MFGNKKSCYLLKDPIDVERNQYIVMPVFYMASKKQFSPKGPGGSTVPYGQDYK
jgi:hypothetical protein